MPRGRGDRERHQQAAADLQPGGQQRREGQVDVIAEQVLHAGIGRGHVLDVELGAALEALEDQVAERSRAGRGRGEVAAAAELDKVRDRLHAQRRIGDQHVAVGCQHGDMGEILERVVADIGIDRRAGQVRAGAGVHQGVAVGRATSRPGRRRSRPKSRRGSRCRTAGRRSSANSGASSRASWSELPPGANGTTILTGLRRAIPARAPHPRPHPGKPTRTMRISSSGIVAVPSRQAVPGSDITGGTRARSRDISAGRFAARNRERRLQESRMPEGVAECSRVQRSAEGTCHVARPPPSRPLQDRASDRARADGGRDRFRARGRGRGGRRPRVAAVRDAQCRPGARADREIPRAVAQAGERQFLLPHAAAIQQCARDALARSAQALLRGAWHRSVGADPDQRTQPVRRGVLRHGRGDEARSRQLPFRTAAGGPVQAREGARQRDDVVRHHGGRGALARGARRRRHHRARFRGRRPSRHVPVRRSRRAGRHLRAGAADRRRGEAAGDRGRRGERRARDRGGVHAGRGGRAGRQRLYALPGVRK